MIGIIESSMGDYGAANAAFKSASLDLDGKDKIEAESRTTPTASDKSTVHTSHFFTLQFGAYRDKTNATAAIVTLDPVLQKAGLGESWIAEEKDRVGRTMFLVQAGRYPSRTSATSRRNRGDLPQCIVTESP
jgi:septal ring-binding cell division protein DamX